MTGARIYLNKHDSTNINMDHLYDYYKKLPRDDVVGGFIEFSGAGDFDDDFNVDEEAIRAEVYGGGGDAAKSASTIDEGILKLFADDRVPPVNPKRSKARSEDTKTADFGPKAPKKRRKSKKGGETVTAESFTL